MRLAIRRHSIAEAKLIRVKFGRSTNTKRRVLTAAGDLDGRLLLAHATLSLTHIRTQSG